MIYEDVWGSRLEQRVLDIRATKLGDGFAVAWRDVGEREKIERDLRESERRFREFADLLPQVVYETNSDGNLIYANRYAFEIFGYSQDDFDTGLQVLQMIIPEERDRARENTHRIFNGEISRGNEYTALRKYGSTFPIIIYATPISREGKPVGTRGIIIDITERKQVEEALRESEDKFRTLSEESFDGIIVHDNGRILEANRMFAKTWGYEPSEVIGMQTEDFITPESIETAKKAILSGSKKPYEAVARKKDGSLFPVEVIGKTILYKGKNVRISTARDITERKQVEKVLRESEERVRSILENSPDFIFIVDPDEKIQYMNRTIPNLTVEETVGKNVLEFIDPQYHDVNIRSVRHVFQTGESCAIESRSPDIKGNLGWYETRFGPIRSGGQVVAVMGTATDITKRKESEQELKKFKTISDKAEYGSAIADLEGNLLYINESFARIHGYSLHELIGGNLSVLHNDEQMKRFVKLNKHLLEKGSYVGKEVWHTRKDGTSFPALMTATVISNEKEEPSYIAATAIDITERKQAEEALKESEEKHRTYIENAPDAIFVTDSDGRYIEVNDAACRMTGYTREELLKMSIAELSPPDSPPEAFESFADLKRTGKSYGEIGIRRKDGTDIQASINAVTLTGERYMAFCSDITERKRAEEALRESEKRFKYLAELLPQTVFEIDVNGYLTFINDQGFKSYGITREDFERGFHALQLHVPDEHECMKEDIRRVLSGEDIGVVEYTGLRKDGSTFPVLIYSNAIYHNDKSVGIRGISIDITERKRVEEALRESEQKFKAIFEHAQDGILLADSESGKFLTGNPKICQMLGYSIDEIKNLRVEDIHPPEDLPYVRKQFARQLKKEIVVATNLPVQRKDGSVFFADVGSSPVTIEGKTYLAGIFRDITERKETEESLKESEQRFRELADLLPQIVFEVDAEGKFSFVNRHAVESTGYSQEEFYENLSPVQLTPPEHREITQKNFQRIFDGDKIVGEEQIIRRKDGTTFPIISYVNPVIRDGKVAGLRGMIVDITERKRSEEALLVSKTHLLNALRIAKLGNWEYDVAKDLFIFNDEFYTLFRTTAEEAGGYTMPSARYAEMFVHPEDRVVVGDEVRKAIESADPNYSRQVEHRIVYADGEIGYIAVRFQIVKDSEGRTVKTYGVNQDITERKLAE
ncbi:PAS domain S-box protein, partial [bacterium]|nr:PAS domain S-box protein [bacterium]